MPNKVPNLSLIIRPKDIANFIKPHHKSDGSAGLSIFAQASHIIRTGERATIPTGFEMSFNACFVGKFYPCPGHFVRYGLEVLTAMIDSDFPGELVVILENRGFHDVHITRGDELARLGFQLRGMAEKYTIVDKPIPRPSQKVPRSAVPLSSVLPVTDEMSRTTSFDVVTINGNVYVSSAGKKASYFPLVVGEDGDGMVFNPLFSKADMQSINKELTKQCHVAAETQRRARVKFELEEKKTKGRVEDEIDGDEDDDDMSPTEAMQLVQRRLSLEEKFLQDKEENEKEEVNSFILGIHFLMEEVKKYVESCTYTSHAVPMPNKLTTKKFNARSENTVSIPVCQVYDLFTRAKQAYAASETNFDAFVEEMSEFPVFSFTDEEAFTSFPTFASFLRTEQSCYPAIFIPMLFDVGYLTFSSFRSLVSLCNDKCEADKSLDFSRILFVQICEQAASVASEQAVMRIFNFACYLANHTPKFVLQPGALLDHIPISAELFLHVASTSADTIQLLNGYFLPLHIEASQTIEGVIDDIESLTPLFDMMVPPCYKEVETVIKNEDFMMAPLSFLFSFLPFQIACDKCGVQTTAFLPQIEKCCFLNGIKDSCAIFVDGYGTMTGFLSSLKVSIFYVCF